MVQAGSISLTLMISSFTSSIVLCSPHFMMEGIITKHRLRNEETSSVDAIATELLTFLDLSELTNDTIYPGIDVEKTRREIETELSHDVLKPNSHIILIGEQPNPCDLLQPQDVMSRHQDAKRCRRYELLNTISLLSPAYLLSVE
ncbi:Cell wall-associated hydrolase [Dirofilaria immitis]|nr:Cell wall-associated hydrolase [Dirofilaria immitis]